MQRGKCCSHHFAGYAKGSSTQAKNHNKRECSTADDTINYGDDDSSSTFLCFQPHVCSSRGVHPSSYHGPRSQVQQKLSVLFELYRKSLRRRMNVGCRRKTSVIQQWRNAHIRLLSVVVAASTKKSFGPEKRVQAALISR